jgi:hypothetical protein
MKLELGVSVGFIHKGGIKHSGSVKRDKILD